MVSSSSKGTKDMIGWFALELKRGRSAREPGRSFRIPSIKYTRHLPSLKTSSASTHSVRWNTPTPNDSSWLSKLVVHSDAMALILLTPSRRRVRSSCTMVKTICFISSGRTGRPEISKRYALSLLSTGHLDLLGRLLRRASMQDLIMFEGDASFTRVPNAPGGRTYVLKFQSSDQRHFVSSQVT